MPRSKCNNVPTKPRIRALLLHQGLLSHHFPIKLVIGLGIALTTCGVIIGIFGFVLNLLESDSFDIGLWVGAAIIVCGLLAIISGNQPHSATGLYTLLFSSIFAVAVSGFLVILTANAVINDHEISALLHTEKTQLPQLNLEIRQPTVMVHSLTLAFSALALLMSFINFCISCHETCQCYASGGILNIDDPLDALGRDSLARRDRIMQWIMQQSDLQHNKLHSLAIPPPSPIISSTFNKQRLRQLDSTTSTISTRLSAYDK